MYSRRPLQALSISGGHSRELNTTPKSYKDPNSMLKTPVDSGKVKSSLSKKNTLQEVGKAQPSKREAPSGQGTVRAANKSSRTAKGVQPAGASVARLPFTIFEDDAAASTSKPKTVKPRSDDEENIRPLAELREGHRKRERTAQPSETPQQQQQPSAEPLLRAMSNGTGEQLESYWKDIAEQRRLALLATLEENEKLHLKVKAVQADCAALEAVAAHAEYFKGIVCDTLASEGVNVLNRSVQTDMEMGDFEAASEWSEN